MVLAGRRALSISTKTFAARVEIRPSRRAMFKLYSERADRT
ncbi:hypothetical protein SCE1572_20475 [Sorangium cellulosum So0157-2]|uniref:Uncharacterized protein n=1 Tax=Sorangium cellulosum So0157-2 TaxID=1254432 RepID=S4XXM7_SORCE|nr:hypothetical protein SCE1572_20475 [Sorangium cellulosum So0157-2]